MLEAKDTVNPFIKLDLEELLRLRVEEIKQQQAVISFKAGKEAALKEVGEWLKKPCPHGNAVDVSRRAYTCQSCMLWLISFLTPEEAEMFTDCPECLGSGKHRYFDGGVNGQWKECRWCKGTGLASPEG